jgi:sulfite oxidase
MINFTRRDILRGAGASLLLGAAGCSIFGRGGSGKDLLTRQETPFNAEPSLERLVRSWITPFPSFYVRNHGTMPSVDPAAYKLTIEGLVAHPMSFTLEQLQRMDQVTVPATLQCAGNRRSEQNLVKPVSGVLWNAGAISTAEWKGVRLAELLERAGAKPPAKYVWFEGRDAVTLKDRQTLFGGQVPIEKATRPETIVALEMNGSPLSREHGFPARTIVPGYIGARSVKWLGRIVVSEGKSDNNFVARDYKLFPPEATPDTVRPQDFDPIYDNSLNSAICEPLAGQTVDAGKLRVRGYALPPGAVGAAIATVEVSPDGGATWVPAKLEGKDAPFSWKLWSAEVELAAGMRTLVVRATDSKGQTQPERAAWNFKGYLYNGWHRVPITVA